eukprot:gene1219-2370_t
MVDKMSIDDLRFEIKRLKQRCDVCERENAILKAETEIRRTVGGDQATITALTNELEIRTRLIHKYRENYPALLKKYAVIHRHLTLEKKALHEIVVELTSGISAIKTEFERRINITTKYLQENIFTLENKYAEKSKLLETANKDIDILKSNIQENQLTLTSLQKIISTLEHVNTSEKQALQTEITSLLTQIHVLNINIQDKDDQFSLLQMQTEESNTRNKALEFQLQDINNQIQNYSSKINSLQSSLCDIKQKNEDLLVEKEKLQDIFSNYQITNDTLQVKINESESKYESSISSIQLNQLKISSYEEQIKTNSIEIQQLKFKNIQINEQYNTLEQEYLKMKSKEINLLHDINKNGSEYEEMRSKLINIQEKMKEIDTDHLQELSRLKNIQKEHEKRIWETIQDRDQIINNNILLESQKRELSNQISDLKLKCDELLKTNIELEKNNLKLEQDNNKKKTNLSSLEDSLRQLRQDRDDINESLIKIRNESSSKDKSFRELQDRISSVHTELEVKSNELKLLKTSKGQNDNCEVQLQEKMEEIATLKQTIRRECEERTELIIEISEIKQLLNQYTKKSSLSSSSSLSLPISSSRNSIGGDAAVGGGGGNLSNHDMSLYKRSSDISSSSSLSSSSTARVFPENYSLSSAETENQYDEHSHPHYSHSQSQSRSTGAHQRLPPMNNNYNNNNANISSNTSITDANTVEDLKWAKQLARQGHGAGRGRGGSSTGRFPNRILCVLHLSNSVDLQYVFCSRKVFHFSSPWLADEFGHRKFEQDIQGIFDCAAFRLVFLPLYSVTMPKISTGSKVLFLLLVTFLSFPTEFAQYEEVIVLQWIHLLFLYTMISSVSSRDLELTPCLQVVVVNQSVAAFASGSPYQRWILLTALPRKFACVHVPASILFLYMHHYFPKNANIRQIDSSVIFIDSVNTVILLSFPTHIPKSYVASVASVTYALSTLLHFMTLIKTVTQNQTQTFTRTRPQTFLSTSRHSSKSSVFKICVSTVAATLAVHSSCISISSTPLSGLLAFAFHL